MTGRFGNQLFQYAFAKRLQAEADTEIIIDFEQVEAKKTAHFEQGWGDRLQDFDFHYRSDNLSKQALFRKYLTLPQQFFVLLHIFWIEKFLTKAKLKNYHQLGRLGKAYARLLYRQGLYIFPTVGALPFPSSKKVKQLFLRGNFEMPESLESIKTELLEEMAIQPSEKIAGQLAQMAKENAVCLTIRRGDYLSEEVAGRLFQCDENYFRRGIELIKAKVENPVFYFFSDDLAYAADFARQTMSSEDRYFIEQAGNSIAEKMLLMKACKHFVISNSTFSWWAQFLAEYENKIVVGPRRWYAGDDELGKSNALVGENWVKIP